MLLRPSGDDWVAVGPEPLPVDQLASWPVLPRCGATVVFLGTVRDHSEGRPGVSSLEYEAYLEGANRAMASIAVDVRRRWPATGRVALLHRTGLLAPTEVSVAVGVSSPHRVQAFDAATYAISTLKATVPIWKHEVWAGGAAWGLDASCVENSRVENSRVEARA